MPSPRRLLRRIPVIGILERTASPAVKKIQKMGFWETVPGQAVKFAGKWIGAPLGVSFALGQGGQWVGRGLQETGEGIQEFISGFRHGVGWYTPVEQASIVAQAQALQAQAIAKELEAYKDYLNALRQAQGTIIFPGGGLPGFAPEWYPGGQEAATGAGRKTGFDWTWLILIAGLGVIAYGFFKK